MSTDESVTHIGDFSPGTRIELTNGNPHGIRYTFDYGGLGKLDITLPPGGAVMITVGNVGVPKIHSNDGAPAGIQLIR